MKKMYFVLNKYQSVTHVSVHTFRKEFEEKKEKGVLNVRKKGKEIKKKI